MNNVFFLYVDNKKFTISRDFLNKYKESVFYDCFINKIDSEYIYFNYTDNNNNSATMVDIDSKYIKSLISIMRNAQLIINMKNLGNIGQSLLQDIKRSLINVHHLLIKLNVKLGITMNEEENILKIPNLFEDSDTISILGSISESGLDSDSDTNLNSISESESDSETIFEIEKKDSETQSKNNEDSKVDLINFFTGSENTNTDDKYNKLYDLITSHNLSDEYKLSKILNVNYPDNKIKHILTPLKK